MCPPTPSAVKGATFAAVERGSMGGDPPIDSAALERRTRDVASFAKQSAAVTSAQAAAAAAQYGEKLSSLQMFVIADTDCEEQSPSSFSAHEVHKIAQVY